MLMIWVALEILLNRIVYFLHFWQGYTQVRVVFEFVVFTRLYGTYITKYLPPKKFELKPVKAKHICYKDMFFSILEPPVYYITKEALYHIQLNLAHRPTCISFCYYYYSSLTHAAPFFSSGEIRPNCTLSYYYFGGLQFILLAAKFDLQIKKQITTQVVQKTCLHKISPTRQVGIKSLIRG